jgi:UDP:flavonoid glycosyltransferase YjiC (YdhE family)
LHVAYFAPYGVGLGHANRLVNLAERLESKELKVKFSSFGEAAVYLSASGYYCATVSPVEFAWSMEGGFSIKDSIANIPVWFANFTRQIKQEASNMLAYGPDVVVSDSRLSPVMAAKLLRIPSIVILNQIKLLLSPRLRDIALSRVFENMTGEFLGSMWNLADRVLIPDLPPPYTISAHNIWGIGSTAKKLEYIGFTSPKPSVGEKDIDDVTKRLNIDRSRPLVFIHISGPGPTRAVLLKVALEATKKLNNKIQYVISAGKPNGLTEPTRLGQSGWFYEWCPVRDELFAMSDMLMVRGGHVAITQAIQFGKPVITVPIENHGELLGNSEKISRLGMGIMVHP